MDQLKERRIRPAILLLLLVCLIGAALPFLRETRAVLVLEERDSGEQWHFVLEDAQLALGFIHSVMKTPVEERYRADPELGLVLVETLYQSYGVGLPFLPEDGELVIGEDGVFVLRMERVIGELNMTLSSIPDHYLSVNGIRHELTPLLGGGAHRVRLRVEYSRFRRFAPYSTMHSDP